MFFGLGIGSLYGGKNGSSFASECDLFVGLHHWGGSGAHYKHRESDSLAEFWRIGIFRRDAQFHRRVVLVCGGTHRGAGQLPEHGEEPFRPAGAPPFGSPCLDRRPFTRIGGTLHTSGVGDEVKYGFQF